MNRFQEQGEIYSSEWEERKGKIERNEVWGEERLVDQPFYFRSGQNNLTTN